MPTALKEEAWQSGLVLSDGTAEWNEYHNRRANLRVSYKTVS